MLAVAREYVATLQRSFAATYALLERPKAARRAVVFLLAIQTGLLAYSAYVHSPTLNEPGHLVAGLSYWKFGRFDVYNVNPPLVKMVAALPVIAAGYEEDWSGFYTGLGARPEFSMGEDFVAANGERSFFLFMVARWACIPFSWLGGIVCYLWARDLYGRPAGVIACVIWSFEPNILAHASLMTPDAHATSLGLAACYTFWRWLRKPSWSQAVLTGVVLGLAELAKTTLILFYPLWPILWLTYRWLDRQRMGLTDWLRETGMLAARLVIGLYILNLGYGFEGSFTALQDYTFVSGMFSGTATIRLQPTYHAKQSTVLTSKNRFASSWIGSIPMPFPSNYIAGIDQQQCDFENSGESYLCGKWSSNGWRHFYIYAVALKVPLGALLLIAITTAISSLRVGGSGVLTGSRDTLMLLLPPLVIFSVASIKSGLCEHLRYVLPCFPFVFIWSSQIVSKHFILALPSSAASWLGTVAVVCFGWLMSSSLFVYPHSLSYFNELACGPLYGGNYLIGSSIDWGQDFLYLKKNLVGTSADCHAMYYGGFDPERTNISPPNALKGDRRDRESLTKYIAISETLRRHILNETMDGVAPTHPLMERISVKPCVLNGDNFARAGYSIRIFQFEQLSDKSSGPYLP